LDFIEKGAAMRNFKSIFKPPEALEYEQDKKVKFLHTTLWVIFFAMIIFVYLNIGPDYSATATAMFVTSGICLLGLYLNSKGHYFSAAVIITVVVLYINFFNLFDGVSLADPGITAFPIILIFSGFLFGKKAIIPITGINLASIYLLVYLERSGVITPPGLSSNETVIILSVLLIASAILLRAIMDNWEYTLERARSSEKQLRLALDEVSNSRDQLEIRVQERTHELEETNRELEAFAYSVSHDLRAPLRAINGFSEILTEEFSNTLDEEGKTYLEKIITNGSRMNGLIDDMLLLSQVGRGDLEPQDINLGLVAEGIFNKLSGEEPEREIIFNKSDCPLVKADRNLIEIMLTNLISNALKFSKGREGAEIEFGWIKDDNEKTTFYLRDNGIGFDMDFADKIFAPFQRLHGQDEYEGTGVGLAIVHRIVQRHNGKIWFDSEVDAGTTVYFRLGVGRYT
jgi:signal transduction histidine kinase